MNFRDTDYGSDTSGSKFLFSVQWFQRLMEIGLAEAAILD